MSKDDDKKDLKLAVIRGTHLALLDPNHIRKGDVKIRVAALSLGAISNIYDAFLPLRNVNDIDIDIDIDIDTACLESSNDCDCDYDFNIEELVLNDNDFGDDEFSLVRYPSDEGWESAYAGDCKQVHIQRIPDSEVNTFVCSVNGSDADVNVNGGQEDQAIKFKLASSGYIIGDFYGTNGYEQILFLPPSLALGGGVLDSAREHVENVAEQKLALQQTLSKCILVDGVRAMYKGTYNIAHFVDAERVANIQLSSEPLSLSEQRKKRKIGAGNNESVSVLREQSTLDVNHTVKNGQESRQEKTWEKMLRNGLVARLQHELALQSNQRAIANMKEQLVCQSQRVLKEISIDGLEGGRNQRSLEMIRIRYTMNPLNDVGNGNGLSLQMHLEVDLASKSLKNHDHGKDISESNLYDVQLSCSPRSEQRGLSVLTSSSLVPIFGNADCFTMMVSLSVSDIKMPTYTLDGDIIWQDTDNGDLRLTLTAFYRDNAIELENEKARNKGLVLGFISIPYENMLLRGNSKAENLKICRTIDFKKPRDHSGNSYESVDSSATAIFENRVPYVCTIDVSNSASNDIQGDWEKIAESINCNVSAQNSNCVRCQYNQQTKKIELILFSSSPEQRLFLLQLVLRCIPSDATIDGACVECVNDDYLVKSFATAILKEIDIIEHHIHISGTKALSTNDRVDIYKAQSDTDAICGRIFVK